MKLNILGWNDVFENAFNEYNNLDYKVGRVFAEYKGFYKVIWESGEVLAEISGKLLYTTEQQQDFPSIGDWVVMTIRENENKATIHHVLPRKSKFSRKVAGKEQIVASNIDTVFVVSSLNNDFNTRRIERYLVLAWESGANPVIILSKSDLCEDLVGKLAETENVAPGVPVHAISTYTNTGLEAIKQYFGEGKTLALLGSSGVGKSSIINHLLGESVQKIGQLRNDGQKGRHTSTHREMFILPDGGLVIDTPGMREIQLWDAESGLQDAFEDIEIAAKQCFFKDCKHEKEPNCAVKEAISAGIISEARLESYKKLQKELQYLQNKQNGVARTAERKSKLQAKSPRPKIANYENY